MKMGRLVAVFLCMGVLGGVHAAVATLTKDAGSQQKELSIASYPEGSLLAQHAGLREVYERAYQALCQSVRFHEYEPLFFAATTELYGRGDAKKFRSHIAGFEKFLVAQGGEGLVLLPVMQELRSVALAMLPRSARKTWVPWALGAGAAAVALFAFWRYRASWQRAMEKQQQDLTKKSGIAVDMQTDSVAGLQTDHGAGSLEISRHQQELAETKKKLALVSSDLAVEREISQGLLQSVESMSAELEALRKHITLSESSDKTQSHTDCQLSFFVDGSVVSPILKSPDPSFLYNPRSAVKKEELDALKTKAENLKALVARVIANAEEDRKQEATELFQRFEEFTCELSELPSWSLDEESIADQTLRFDYESLECLLNASQKEVKGLEESMAALNVSNAALREKLAAANESIGMFNEEEWILLDESLHSMHEELCRVSNDVQYKEQAEKNLKEGIAKLKKIESFLENKINWLKSQFYQTDDGRELRRLREEYLVYQELFQYGQSPAEVVAFCKRSFADDAEFIALLEPIERSEKVAELRIRGLQGTRFPLGRALLHLLREMVELMRAHDGGINYQREAAWNRDYVNPLLTAIDGKLNPIEGK